MKNRKEVKISSTSVFILTFRDEESIETELKQDFKQNGIVADKYFDELLTDIKKSHRFSIREVEEDIIESYRYDVDYIMVYGMLPKILKKDDLELVADSYVDRKEKQEEVEELERLSDDLNNAIKKIGKNKVIVEVKYSSPDDGGDGVLRETIIPHLNCRVKEIICLKHDVTYNLFKKSRLKNNRKGE